MELAKPPSTQFLLKGGCHQAQPSYRAQVAQVSPSDYLCARHRIQEGPDPDGTLYWLWLDARPSHHSTKVNHIKASPLVHRLGDALKEEGQPIPGPATSICQRPHPSIYPTQPQEIWSFSRCVKMWKIPWTLNYMNEYPYRGSIEWIWSKRDWSTAFNKHTW